MTQNRGRELSGPGLIRRVQRRRRLDGYLIVAAVAPVLGRQALRAFQDRNGWGLVAAAAPLAAGIVRAECSARQLPAQWRAAEEHVRQRHSIIAAARDRGEDPQAAANEHARRHGVSVMPALAGALVFIAGQLWRRSRPPLVLR